MDPYGHSNADMESIINEHTNVFQNVRQAAREHAVLTAQIGPDPSRPAALLEAPPKEQEKKKPPSKKDKTKGRSSKSKASASQATEFPGAVPGVEVNSSALWVAAESYFRDVTAEDLMWLCPAQDDPYEDPLFHVPDLGPPFESMEEQQAKARQQAGQALKPRSRNKLSLADGVNLDPAEAPSSAGREDKQRKSSRLGAKAASRGEDPTGLSPGAAASNRMFPSVMASLRSSLPSLDAAEQPEVFLPPQSPAHHLTDDQLAFMQDWALRCDSDDQAGPSQPATEQHSLDASSMEAPQLSNTVDPGQSKFSDGRQKHLARVALYTREMLRRPPTSYVESADTVREVSHQAVQEHSQVAGPGSFDTPQASEVSRGAGHELTADTATGQTQLANQSQPPATPGEANLAMEPSGTRVKGPEHRSLQPGEETPGPSLPGPLAHPLKTGRPGKSRFASGPSKGSLATQSKTNAGKTGGKAGPQLDPSKNAITAALAAHVAAGPEEGDLEAQWKQLEDSAEIVAMAPDDEILAEIYALQSELIQQMAINRRRAAPLLQQVLKDLPRQRQARQARTESTQVAKDWILKQRAAKRIVKREKREAAQREALKASEVGALGSPRKLQSRLRNQSLDHPAPLPLNAAPLPEVPLYDLLAERRAEDDALCAVCGGGDSDKTAENEIVFCERCDVAVHQKCYAIDVIPAGEWLCWPCKKFEEAELASGKTQSEIRPPRADTGSPTIAAPNRSLPGGGRTVPCALCPARRGAFRQTLDGKHWVHQVCALWHPEPRVAPGNVSEVIEGLEDIKPDRWNGQCSICRRTEGAIVRCNAGHCAVAFHPICARNSGQHLTTRDPGTSKAVHRAYCLQHSEAQRNKDLGNESDGSATFLRNQVRIKQHLDKVNATAIEALKVRQDERAVLTRVRLELESLRILLQRVNKREKLKRDVLKATYELHQSESTAPETHLNAGPFPASEANHAAVNGRGVKRKAITADQQAGREVEREVVMTPDEAAETNDRLPKGFMYVRMNEFNTAGAEPSGKLNGIE